MHDDHTDVLDEWLRMRDARHDEGRLRPGREENAAFERVQTWLDTLDPETRERALARMRPRVACGCGHPEAHHLDGRCFHVIGCATGCDCGIDRTGTGMTE